MNRRGFLAAIPAAGVALAGLAINRTDAAPVGVTSVLGAVEYEIELIDDEIVLIGIEEDDWLHELQPDGSWVATPISYAGGVI